ncbi:DUF3866 family protein [Paenibacillus cremeus]|uniref:DUF3866 family protein n=2 Tax=Paenibacillus cremeus TaxID=2163881 RepID=A0A559KHV6_9BACL|nr:DUF3866 family protein [Paenibacillus cremeus]
MLTMADGSCCRAVHDLTAFEPLEPGDHVLANVTAVSLGLGTGGVHFVHAPLQTNRPTPLFAPGPGPGHIMKLRYTSLQRSVLAAEEEASPHHAVLAGARSLEQLPVLIGELHSMLPAAVSWLRYRTGMGNSNMMRPLRIAYIMTDGGSLPLAVSRHAARLKALGWLAGTITYGHAYGGDLEAVNKYTALLAAKHVLHADLAIVTMGPGIVGTGTALGFSGMETGELVNAVRALGGLPVFIPRISFGDARERHCGLSHHTRTALGTAAIAEAIVPLPLLGAAEQLRLLREQAEDLLEREHELRWIAAPAVEQMETAFQAYEAPITSMGRGLLDDPLFFAAVCAAADAALQLICASPAASSDLNP